MDFPALSQAKQLFRRVQSTMSLGRRRLEYYRQIKLATHGMLAPEVYEQILLDARAADEGAMIDIGPAQGGSSIALGLGIRASRKKHSTVYSIEKGSGSSALVSKKDVGENEEVLKRNIRAYGVEPTSVVLMGDVKDVADRVPLYEPISLLFIDADGALDRDFQLFYNRVIPGAPIILDDVADVINRHARENYLTMNDEGLGDYVRRKGVASFRDACPLGKEYTTWRFTGYFLQRGLIEHIKTIGSTFFGRKPRRIRGNVDLPSEDFIAIRDKIVGDFYALRAQNRQAA